jgi:xanthine dehydrogenase accessory factor
LGSLGFGADDLARLHSPIGLIPATRTPSVLALSVLAEVVGCYEGLLG